MSRQGSWRTFIRPNPRQARLRSERFYIKRDVHNPLIGSLRTMPSIIDISGKCRVWCAGAVTESPQEVSSQRYTALTACIAASLRHHLPGADIIQIRLGDFKSLVNIAPPFINPRKENDRKDSMISSPLSQSSYAHLLTDERSWIYG